MKRNDSVPTKVSITLVQKVHQDRLSERLNKRGITCRFYPTCSNYFIMASKKYGFIKGCVKTVNRIRRCKPDNHNSCVDYP